MNAIEVLRHTIAFIYLPILRLFYFLGYGSTQLLYNARFSMQMLANQTSSQKGNFGFLNVYACYDKISGELKVDVISAENLVPLDLNGQSDPFVVVR